MHCRNVNPHPLQSLGKRAHGRLLAMNQEYILRLDRALPVQQFGSVGMGGKTVNGVNFRLDRQSISKDMNEFCPIDDMASKGMLSSVAHEDDA